MPVDDPPRRSDIAELEARDAGPRRVISAPYGHERGSTPADYAEMVYQGGGRLSDGRELPHLYENARRYDRAADAEAMNKIRVSLSSPDTTERHR